MLWARPQGVAACAPERFGLVAREFPCVEIELPPRGLAAVCVGISDWRDDDFDPWAFDRAIDRAAAATGLAIEVVGDVAELPGASLEILTRCQRQIRQRNHASATNLFAAVLECHRDLHDLDQLPLVQADYDHALDVWQWLLRLAPEASLAVQIAALFHDIERLVSEPERRIEQHASDYQAFKANHAALGAELAATRIRAVGAPDELVHEVARLIAAHEQQSDDPDIALLNDADALSFFSLNSAGFADYFGLEHTRKKIAYSLNRLRRPARRHLDHVHVRAIVRVLIAEALERERLRSISTHQAHSSDTHSSGTTGAARSPSRARCERDDSSRPGESSRVCRTPSADCVARREEGVYRAILDRRATTPCSSGAV